MPRIYAPVGPTSNKAENPVKETKKPAKSTEDGKKVKESNGGDK